VPVHWKINDCITIYHEFKIKIIVILIGNFEIHTGVYILHYSPPGGGKIEKTCLGRKNEEREKRKRGKKEKKEGEKEKKGGKWRKKGENGGKHENKSKKSLLDPTKLGGKNRFGWGKKIILM